MHCLTGLERPLSVRLVPPERPVEKETSSNRYEPYGKVGWKKLHTFMGGRNVINW